MYLEEYVKTLPHLCATEDKDPTVKLRAYDPKTGWSWFPIEFDGEDTMFCLIDGYDNELGYVSLRELKETVGSFVYYRISKRLSKLMSEETISRGW